MLYRVHATMSLVDATLTPGLQNEDGVLPYLTKGEDIKQFLDSTYMDTFNNQAIIKTEKAEILIPSNSGLARELQNNRRASFSISPIGGNHNFELGHYALWDVTLDSPSAPTLIDMFLTVSFNNSSCLERIFTIRHKGTGYRFVPSEGLPYPILSVARPRMMSESYFLNNEDENLKNRISFWTRNRRSLFGLANKEYPGSYDPEGTYPLLGLPVMGNYELLLTKAAASDQSNAQCSYKDASFTLNVIFSHARFIPGEQ